MGRDEPVVKMLNRRSKNEARLDALLTLRRNLFSGFVCEKRISELDPMMESRITIPDPSGQPTRY